MKRKTYILSFFSIFILGFVFITYSYASFRNKTEPIKRINISKLKHGDLILRCGRSTESYVVHLADANSEFTHIGIVSLENGIPYIIHAVPHKNEFIKKEILNQFLNPKHTKNFAIYRANFPREIIKKVVNQARIFYNKKYKFDNEYNLKTNSKLYCTELILKAFKNNNISLNINTTELNFLVGKHTIILPSEFTKLPFKQVNINF